MLEMPYLLGSRSGVRLTMYVIGNSVRGRRKLESPPGGGFSVVTPGGVVVAGGVPVGGAGGAVHDGLPASPTVSPTTTRLATTARAIPKAHFLEQVQSLFGLNSGCSEKCMTVPYDH